MSENNGGPFDWLAPWLAMAGCLLFIGVIALISNVADKHGDAIMNNLGNKIEAWTK